MCAYELSLDPICDYWLDQELPSLCKAQMKKICEDILKNGDQTRYQTIYDAIYEIVQSKIENEQYRGFNHD